MKQNLRFFGYYFGLLGSSWDFLFYISKCVLGVIFGYWIENISKIRHLLFYLYDFLKVYIKPPNPRVDFFPFDESASELVSAQSELAFNNLQREPIRDCVDIFLKICSPCSFQHINLGFFRGWNIDFFPRKNIPWIFKKVFTK